MHTLSTTHPMMKITWSAIIWKPVDQSKKENGVVKNIFLHLYADFGLKNQNTNAWKSLSNFFAICKIST